MQFSSIWSIDSTLSSGRSLSQSGPGSGGIEGVLCIPQSSSIIGASPSDCLLSYLGHLFGESYFSAEMPSVYSAVPVNGVKKSDRANFTEFMRFCES